MTTDPNISGLYLWIVDSRNAAMAEAGNHPDGSPRRWYWQGRGEVLATVMTEMERRGITE